MKKILVVVGGPTASGKTALAIQLAQQFNTEIISADSRQFYKELSIGTAKPTNEELAQAPHHFINSHSVINHLNAGEYGELALELIHFLFLHHHVLIMAGGSGLYIDAVVNGIDDLPAANPEIRNSLNKLYEESGIEAIQQLLLEKDPAGYNMIDDQNPRRLIRAIEICLTANAPFSELIKKNKPKYNFEVLMCGVEWPREDLYERINLRVKQMIGEGLKEETLALVSYKNLTPLKTVGYKEMFEHIDGNISLEATIQLIAKNTRNYAKRQMTWFRRYPEMIWIKPGEVPLLIDKINKISSQE